MQTEMPFFEGPEDALREAVRAIGGPKKVGPMLWPDKTPDAAFQFIGADVGYEVRPVTREEEVDRVTSIIETTSAQLATAIATLQRLQSARRVA